MLESIVKSFIFEFKISILKLIIDKILYLFIFIISIQFTLFSIFFPLYYFSHHFQKLIIDY